MADEIAKRDENRKIVLLAVTDDAAEELVMLRVDSITSRLEVDVEFV